MRFIVQGLDKDGKSWNILTRTPDISLAKALVAVRGRVEKTHQGMRIITGGRRPQKLVTIKWGHDKKIAVTFTPVGMERYRAEVGDRSRASYLRGIGNGKGSVYADQAESRDHIAGSKQKAIADYNHYLRTTGRLQRMMGNTPRIHRCLKCGWYFTKPGPGKSPACSSCHSRNTKTVRGRK